MEVRERLTGASFPATSQSGEILLGTGAKEKYGWRWIPLVQQYSFAVGLYSDIFRLRSEFRQTEVFSDVIAALRHLSKLYVLIPMEAFSSVGSVADILADELRAAGFDDDKALKEFLDLPGWNASSVHLRVDADEGTVSRGRTHVSSPALVQALDAVFLSTRVCGIDDTIRRTWTRVEVASINHICQITSPLRQIATTRHARHTCLNSPNATADSVVICGGVLRVLNDALKENRKAEQGSDGSSMTGSSGRDRFRRRKVWLKRVFELRASVPGASVAYLTYKSVKHFKKRNGTLCFDSQSEVRVTSSTSFSLKLRTGRAMTFMAKNEDEVRLWATHLQDVISCLGDVGREEKTEDQEKVCWSQRVVPSLTAIGALIFCQWATAMLVSLIMGAIAFCIVPILQRTHILRDLYKQLKNDDPAEQTELLEKRKLTCDSKFQADDPREMVAYERFRHVLRKKAFGRRSPGGLPPIAECTPDLLLKFLRFADPSLASFVDIEAEWTDPVQMATLFEEYIEAKSNNKLLEHMVGEPSARMRELYDLKFLRVLPRAQDRNGCRILLVTPANLPKDIPLEDIELIVGYFLVHACLDDRFLSPGFVIILDLANLSKTSAWAISKRFTKKVAHAIAPREAIPIKMQKIIFVNFSSWVQLLWTVLKTFFLHKRHHDVAVYCRNCDDLHQFVDPTELPAQLGGPDADDEREWIDDWMLRNAQVLLGKTQKDAKGVVELENFLQMEDAVKSPPLTEPSAGATRPLDTPIAPLDISALASTEHDGTACHSPTPARTMDAECVTQETSRTMEHVNAQPCFGQGAELAQSSGSACSLAFPPSHPTPDTAPSADELSEEPSKMDHPGYADADASLSAEGVSKRSRVSSFLSPRLHKAKNVLSQSKNSLRHRLGRSKANASERELEDEELRGVRL